MTGEDSEEAVAGLALLAHGLKDLRELTSVLRRVHLKEPGPWP
jgi:hypothetical protein